MKKIYTNPIYQFFVTISPWAVLFLLSSSWDPLFDPAPERASLTPLSGTIQRIGKSSGVVNTDSGTVDVKYECLCNYSWSEKLFEKGMPFTALAQPKGNGYYLWDLQVDGREVLTYESKAPKLLERRDWALTYVVPALILFALLSIQLAFQTLRNRRIEKSKKPLYPLLDQLHDQEKSDEERLSVLPEVLKFEPEDTLGPLEFMATQNTNSEAFLTRLGTELGKLWSALDIDELESITLVQPAAKRAAMEVLEKQAPELNTELDSLGALKLGH